MPTEENIVKTETSHSEESIPKFTKAQKKSGNRIGYNYIIIKSLKESTKNDVVKCLYIKSLFDFGICVIKEGTYGDTKDVHGRDIRDRLIWQKELHTMLQHKVKVPRLIGSFEENGNYYLVIERIKGVVFGAMLKKSKYRNRNALSTGTKEGKKLLGYLEDMATLLSKLHSLKIVHRDVTVNNFIITNGGKIAIIDMELGYSLDKSFPSPPFLLGTRGYMSPEQESASPTPTVKEDIYSLGMILLQSWSGIAAIKLNDLSLEDIKRKVPFFIPDKKISDLVIQCIHPLNTERPEAWEIKRVLSEYKKDLSKGIKRAQSQNTPYSKDEILTTIQNGIHTLSTPLFSHQEKGWFSENVSAPQRENDKINKSWYGSFYRGAAGIISFLGIAQSVNMDISEAQSIINIGMDLIAEKYFNKIDQAQIGILQGKEGIAAMLALSIHNNVLQYEPHYIDWMKKLLEGKTDRLSYQDGCAGQGIASLICRQFIEREANVKLQNIVDQLINTQNDSGSWSIQTQQPLGFHSGNAGILHFLIEYAHLSGSIQAAQAAEKGLHWLISKTENSKGSLVWLHDKNQKIGYAMCEGTTGIAFTLLKAYQYFKDPVFKDYASNTLFSNNAVIMHDNLTQCHGISGLGEVYLEAFRILQNEEWLLRAGHIAQVIMNLHKNHPKWGPHWYVGKERQPIANFMIGNSGVMHFLLHYCHPDKIHYPLTKY